MPILVSMRGLNNNEANNNKKKKKKKNAESHAS